MVGLGRAGVNADREFLDMHNSPQGRWERRWVGRKGIEGWVSEKEREREGRERGREERKEGGRRKRKMSSASQAASASTVRR